MNRNRLRYNTDVETDTKVFNIYTDRKIQPIKGKQRKELNKNYNYKKYKN